MKHKIKRIKLQLKKIKFKLYCKVFHNTHEFKLQQTRSLTHKRGNNKIINYHGNVLEIIKLYKCKHCNTIKRINDFIEIDTFYNY